ncbi:MAG: S41 family peptidase [Pirellulaceae bacterium]
MRRTIRLAQVWTLLIFLACAGWTGRSVHAQVLIPQAAMVDQHRVDDVIRQGELLERERRWSDALSYYEEAVRNHPQRDELRGRLTIARTHLDVARRYTDQSFLLSLDRLTERQALELYSEVLLKVDTYHVNNPPWKKLVQCGMVNLEIAATEPAFVDHFPHPVAADFSQAYTDEIHSAIDVNAIENRNQAVDAVATAARIAARRLAVAPQAAILEFTCAAVASLDQYSSYLTGNQLDEVFAQIEGNFVGLGIELKAEAQSLLIVNVIPGGPAAEAGMLAGDRIIEVDGRSTREISTDAAADMLKGSEFSYVQIVLQGPTGSSRKLRVQRRLVDVPSIQDVKMLDTQTGVAYMKLTSFQKTTSRDVDAALWSLHRQGMRSLIIDVRGNPGGLLNASVEVADKFLPSGVIVSTRGRSTREDFDYQAHDAGTWRVPLVVLIDGDSASASEIFAGAVHDHRRGTVVGQRSYGKGSVQGIFPLNRYKAGIRLTTSKFYSPSGQPISDQGVTPHVVVTPPAARVAARVTDAGEIPAVAADPTLQAGLDVARQAANYQVRRTN